MGNFRFHSIEYLREHLEVLASDTPGGGVAFDADGTLWRHDIGVVAFEYFCNLGLIRDPASEHLLSLAESCSIKLQPHESPSQWAIQLNQAYQKGIIDEKAICEMQVWIYAGYSQAELAPHFTRALELSGHQGQLFPEIYRLIEECRRLKLKPFVVSASPVPVLEVALTPEIFSQAEIVGGRLNVAHNKYEAELSHPLPYGIEKAKAGKALLRGTPWLMAIGDSAFDIEMMLESSQGVAIGYKAGLESALNQVAQGEQLFRIKEPRTALELVEA